MSKMERFAESRLLLFAKCSILDALQGFEYAFDKVQGTI